MHKLRKIFYKFEYKKIETSYNNAADAVPIVSMNDWDSSTFGVRVTYVRFMDKGNFILFVYVNRFRLFFFILTGT